MKPTPPDDKLAMIFSSNGVVTHEPISRRPPDVVQFPSDDLSDLGKAQFKAVGVCIYCGATDDLDREHIIPFGLNGTAVLHEASCKECAKITSHFEMQVLRGAMRDVRVLRRLRSRKKHTGVQRVQRLRMRRNGIIETVELPLEDYPVLLHFPTFTLPGVLSGYDGTGIQMTGVATLQFGPLPQAVGKKLGAQEIMLDAQPDHPISFARMIGKIGYAMAVAHEVVKVTERRPEIVASLLNEVDEIGRWVGTVPGPFRKYSDGTLHRVAIQQEANTGLVAVEIQLFADSGAPTYLVILR